MMVEVPFERRAYFSDAIVIVKVQSDEPISPTVKRFNRKSMVVIDRSIKGPFQVGQSIELNYQNVSDDDCDPMVVYSFMSLMGAEEQLLYIKFIDGRNVISQGFGIFSVNGESGPIEIKKLEEMNLGVLRIFSLSWWGYFFDLNFSKPGETLAP